MLTRPCAACQMKTLLASFLLIASIQSVRCAGGSGNTQAEGKTAARNIKFYDSVMVKPLIRPLAPCSLVMASRPNIHLYWAGAKINCV
jgi:hypothetical protein